MKITNDPSIYKKRLGSAFLTKYKWHAAGWEPRVWFSFPRSLMQFVSTLRSEATTFVDSLWLNVNNGT